MFWLGQKYKFNLDHTFYFIPLLSGKLRFLKIIAFN